MKGLGLSDFVNFGIDLTGNILTGLAASRPVVKPCGTCPDIDLSGQVAKKKNGLKKIKIKREIINRGV